MEKKSLAKNGNIYYWFERGAADKPVLIFLHGLSSNHTTWDPTIALMRERGFGVLAPDLRGHGLSDKTRRRNLYRLPVMREDVEEIIKAEEIKNFVIIGYSYGGYIGVDFAIAHPSAARGLVLISANHTSPFDYHGWCAFMSPVSRFATNLLGWLFLWQKRKNYYYFEPESAKTRGYWHSTFSGYATMPLSINFWMLSEVFAMDYRRSVHRIECSTLIIRGANDTFITQAEVDDMQKNIPHAEVATLGLGHYVASHYQKQTAETILKFLETLS